MILGIVGKLASGKSEAAKYIKNNYNSQSFKYSDVLQDILGQLFLEESRENLSKLSQALREYFGEEILAKVITNRIGSSTANIKITEGIRRPEDIKFIKNNSSFILVAIEAERRTRFKRIRNRSEKIDDSSKSFEEFIEDEKNPSDRIISEMMKKADRTINNNGSLNEFYSQIDELINELDGSKNQKGR